MIPLIREFGRVLSKNTFIRYEKTPPAPTTVMIGSTNICNLRCFMCGTKNISGPRGFMNLDLYRRIIDQCAAHGVTNVALHTIGEPLLHKDLLTQIRYAKDRGLHVFFSTNGQLLSRKMSEELLGTQLDAMRLSIEGSDSRTYEAIRQGGSFDTLVENLKVLKGLRDEQSSPLRIFITSIVMQQTRRDIRRFLRYFRPMCDGIYFTYLANPGGQVPETREEILDGRRLRPSPCRLLWNTMVIEFDGTVTVCCLDFDNKLTVGDIGRQSLQVIWHGVRYEEYRRLHREGRFDDMPLCGTCNKEVNSASRLFWLNVKARLFGRVSR